MKIAITADLHLTTQKKHPERFHTLEKMLLKIGDENIRYLIVAGDLFDLEQPNYADFERLANDQRFASIQFLIIPGNHDAGLSRRTLSGRNIHVFDHVELVRPAESEFAFMFVPYSSNTTFGEKINSAGVNRVSDRWILIGHGDYLPGIPSNGCYEDGVYMPLSRQDLLSFNPSLVFLGHIHKPGNIDGVYLPGSPCPVDRSETGRRRFLTWDSRDNSVASLDSEAEVLFLREELVVIPSQENEEMLLQNLLGMVAKWELSPSELKRLHLHLAISGFCRDRTSLVEKIQNSLAPLVRLDELDITHLSSGESGDGRLAETILQKITALEPGSFPSDIQKQQIAFEALQYIYGR